jgi:transcriptional regulator with XRE-family HTH domain
MASSRAGNFRGTRQIREIIAGHAKEKTRLISNIELFYLIVITGERQKVKRWLRENHMTLKELARRGGITPTTIWNLLTGLSQNAESRQKLTDAIGITVWSGTTPRPRLVLVKNDPSALDIAIETAKRSGAAGVQVEIVDAPANSHREALTGFLGSDGRGVIHACQPEFGEAQSIKAKRKYNLLGPRPEIAARARGRDASRRDRRSVARLKELKMSKSTFEFERGSAA